MSFTNSASGVLAFSYSFHRATIASEARPVPPGSAAAYVLMAWASA